MKKKQIVNLFHYGLKYLLLALPIIFILIAFLIPSNQVVQVNYKYSSNDVNSIDDFIVGNVYTLDILDLYNSSSDGDNFQIDCNYFDVYGFDGVDVYNQIYSQFPSFGIDGYIHFNSDDGVFTIDMIDLENYMSSFNISDYSNLKIDFEFLGFKDFFISDLETFLTSFSKCLNIPIDSIDYVGLNNDIYSWLDNFSNIPINSFYNDIASSMGITINTQSPLGFIYYMPLWIMWIYIFDLMLDFMLFIPKLAHKWLEKFYKDGE